MKSKPLPSNFIALGLLLVPAIIALRLIIISQSQSIQFSFEKVAPIGFLMVAALFIAYGVWKVRMWGFYSLLLLGLIAVTADLYNWSVGRLDFSAWTFLDVATVLVAIILIVQKRVRQPYLDPSIRWWEQAARYRVDIAGAFTVDGKKIETPILDISASGCFANCNFDYEIGTVVQVEIDFNSNKFTSSAVYVRKSETPKGIGLKFTDTSPEAQTAMKKILADIVKSK